MSATERTARRTPSRRGRRPAGSDARGDILDAARNAFAHKGFDRTSIRAIAREAGVDPALVHHYFRDKESLFVAALQFPFVPAEVVPAALDGDPAHVGERVTRQFLAIWGRPETRAPILALLRAAMTHPAAAAMLRGFVTKALLGRIVERIAGEDREQRVEAAVAQLIGVAMLRYVVGVRPMADLTDEEIVALVAPTVQRYLAG